MPSDDKVSMSSHHNAHTPHRRGRSIALWIMHLSIAVILCGGVITHFQERNGHIHLRQGETTHEYLAENQDSTYTPTPLPFYLTLDTFFIEHDGKSHADYVSRVLVASLGSTDTVTIRMNRPLFSQGYRLIQASYDLDMGGTHLGVIHDPWGTGTVIAGFAIFLLAVSFLLYEKGRYFARHGRINALRVLTYRERILALFVSIAAMLPLLPLFFTPLQPILRTPLLYVHVGTVILSYILLVMSLLWRQVLSTAVLLLAIGIILGSFWGSISWGTYWSWDPKETWALITLLLYALPLHSRFLHLLRHPEAYRIYSVICLAALLTTYLGVNFLMQSKHSYL